MLNECSKTLTLKHLSYWLYTFCHEKTGSNSLFLIFLEVCSQVKRLYRFVKEFASPRKVEPERKRHAASLPECLNTEKGTYVYRSDLPLPHTLSQNNPPTRTEAPALRRHGIAATFLFFRQPFLACGPWSSSLADPSSWLSCRMGKKGKHSLILLSNASLFSVPSTGDLSRREAKK